MKRFQFCTSYIGPEILDIRAIQGHSKESLVGPSLLDNVLIPDDFFEFVYHVGVIFQHALHLCTWIDSGSKNHGSTREMHLKPAFALSPDVFNRHLQSGLRHLEKASRCATSNHSSPPRLHVAAPVERLNGGAPWTQQVTPVGETFRRLTPKVAVLATCNDIPHSLVDGHDSGSTVILDRVATLIDIGRAPPYFGLSTPTFRHMPRAGFLCN